MRILHTINITLRADRLIDPSYTFNTPICKSLFMLSDKYQGHFHIL
uniref:Uncharacterized protein n=1 Tax=Anguilla anguilla TaxID=7936 RepID=A0A0E9VWK2_ANGAN